MSKGISPPELEDLQKMTASARKYKLIALTKNKLNPAYTGARLGADRVAARWGCTVAHRVPDKPDDVEEQLALLQGAHAERPDAILLAPAHATALNATLHRVQADGIPVVCIVSRPDGIACTSYVGSDDRALAHGIASYLFSYLPNGGNVVTLEGHPDAITSPPRARGFRDAADAHAGVRIADSRVGYFQRAGGHAAMTEMLATGAPISGVLAANDVMALGALDAMREKGVKIPVVGVNATPEGVEAIKAGDMLASAAFDAMKMACLGTEAAIRCLSGRAVPSEVILPVEIVDRSNYAAWDRDYVDRELPEWERYAPA